MIECYCGCVHTIFAVRVCVLFLFFLYLVFGVGGGEGVVVAGDNLPSPD